MVLQPATGRAEQAETFPALFQANVARLGERAVAIREKDYGIWQSYNWRQVHEEVSAFALGLARMGFQRGDRLCIVGDNRPQLYWGMLAAQCLGGVPVPMYQDSGEKEMAYIVDHADARFALLEDQEQVDKFLAIKAECPKLEQLIYKDPRGLRNYEHEHLHSFAEVQELGRAFGREHAGYLEEQSARVEPDDVAVICYTSGTTGRPKGVLLSHRNIIETSRNIRRFEGLSDRESILAYLPMAWVGDFFLSFGMALVGGYTVNCPESSATVMTDLHEVGPTYFFAPPRIWENLLTSVMIRMEDASWLKRKLFRHALAVAERAYKRRTAGEPVALADRVQRWLYEYLVYGPLKDNLGFSRVRIAYTAGEAIGPELFDFYRSLGINLKQLYGMTEASVFVTLQTNDKVRADTCGVPVPGVELKIAESGEVLFRGPGAFKGYYKNDEATAETITDGWVHTGDAGLVDHEGQLRIIDRAKDVGKLQDGTLFAPKFIENKLKFSPYIKEAVAVGHERPYVACMINIDMDSVGNWAERGGLAYSSYTDLSQKPEVLALIDAEVRRVNDSLAEQEQLRGARIRRWLVLHKELDPDDEEITRTRKVRRRFVAEKYKALIDALYSEADHVQTEAKVTFEDGREGVVRADLKIRTVDEGTSAAAA